MCGDAVRDAGLFLCSVEKIKVLLDAITAIYQQFKKDKAERREFTNTAADSAVYLWRKNHHSIMFHLEPASPTVCIRVKTSVGLRRFIDEAQRQKACTQLASQLVQQHMYL